MYAAEFLKQELKSTHLPNHRIYRELPIFVLWCLHRDGPEEYYHSWNEEYGCEVCKSDKEPCFIGLLLLTALKAQFLALKEVKNGDEVSKRI
jgi:hypothetical protein